MKNKFSHYVLILVIPLLLVLIWFRNGNILGHGESGLPFYNLETELNIFRNAWSNYALGLPVNISVASAPFYLMFSMFQNIGVPGFVLQAFFFWVILVISGFGIFLFTSELFPNLDKKYLILAPLFYWFNPFSLVNVWNRFLNTYIVFYGIIPLALFLFIKGIKTKKYVYSVFIALLTSIFSYAFTAIAFNILFWALIFCTTLFYFFIENRWNERFYIVKFFILTLILFVLINFWWISQVFSNLFFGNFGTVISDFLSSAGNYQTLSILSQRLGSISDLVRLRHASFFGENGIFWLQIYNFPLIVFVEFVVFGVVLFASIKNRRNANALYLALLLIITLFLAKGNNPPFGEIFESLFLRFTTLQAFRNPFEKILFLAPLAASPLFALGLGNLSNLLSKYKQKIIYTGAFLWLAFAWGFPFWTGLVFVNGDSKVLSPDNFEVSVPSYYEQVAEWLNSKEGNFRLLALPIGDEGITYAWQHGYSGIELSNQILPAPSVSLNTTIPYYNSFVSDLDSYISSNEDITKIMNLLNAKYIMLRRDIDWKSRGMRDPQDILIELVDQERIGNIKKVAEFGEISFWENLKWEDNKIFAASSSINISPNPRVLDIASIQNTASILLTANFNNNPKDNIIGYISHPIAKFTLNRKEHPVYEIRQDIFPSVKFLPSSVFYKATLLKEEVEAALIKDKYVLIMQRMTMLGKRLVEAEMESDRQSPSDAITAIIGYQRLLNVTEALMNEINMDLFRQKQVYMQEDIYNMFSRHKVVLADVKNKFSGNVGVESVISKTEKLLSDFEINLNISPASEFVENQDFPINKRIVYKFNIEDPGRYELFWGNESLYKYYLIPGNKIRLQVNPKMVDSDLHQIENRFISFGKLDLNFGINEIGLNTPEEINLVNTPQEFEMKVDHGEMEKTFPIENLDPNGKYSVSFDYFIERGAGLSMQVISDNDKFETIRQENKFLRWLHPVLKTAYFLRGRNYSGPTSIVPTYSKTLFPDFENLDFSEKSVLYYFTVKQGTKNANLVFRIVPWNNCESIFNSFTQRKCSEASFSSAYDKTTQVHIKNIKLIRVLTDEPVLIKENPKQQAVSSLPKVNFTKINDSSYTVYISGSSDPFILVLSELYDNGWRLYDGGVEVPQKNHFLANLYANGWKIDKKGDYNLEIRYVPQDLLSISEKVSIGTFLLGGLTAIWFLFSKENKK